MQTRAPPITQTNGTRASRAQNRTRTPCHRAGFYSRALTAAGTGAGRAG